MKKTKLNPKHLYAIFAFLLSAVVVFCGVQIWQEYSNRQKDIDAFAELSELAEIKEPDEPKKAAEPDTDGDAENSDTDSDTQEEQENPVLTPRHDIPLLISQNSDCIGWITIDNTAVDYPVMHTPEWPQKYLRMNFYQQYSDSGVPFLDYRCTLESDNLIIFGHNMRNGTMFGELSSFGEREFLLENAVVRFDTLYENALYVPFAMFEASMDEDDAHYFDVRQIVFDETSFELFVLKLRGRSVFDVPVAVEYGDQLLTLVTCSYNDDDGRYIVALRKLREGETEEDVREMMAELGA